MKKRVYLGGPINGCADDECKAWRKDVAAQLVAMGFEPVDPLRNDYRGVEMTPEVVNKLVGQDLQDIWTCDVCLFYCPNPSYGTAMEIAYAHEAMVDRGNPRHIFVVLPEGAQDSPWLRYHATSILPSLQVALDVLAAAVAP